MSRILVECGEALYGPQWQSALARDLGISDAELGVSCRSAEMFACYKKGLA